MTAAQDDLGQIANLRIELLDSDPLIWRQVEVSTSSTLKELHTLIQAAMGWANQHLWEFRIGRQVYGQPMPGEGWGGPAVANAGKVRLAELLEPRKTVIDYTYDMGDSWEHRLTLTDLRPADPAVVYPRYVAGDNLRRQKTAAASRAFMRPSKPWPTRTIPNTRTSSTGSTATTRTTSMSLRSRSPLGASRHAAEPPKRAQPDRLRGRATALTNLAFHL